MRRRDDARRDGGRGAARRASRRELPVPGVSGGPTQRRLGGAHDPELGRVGLAEEDEARPEQPPDHLRVLLRHVALEEPRGAGERVALPGGEEVLQEERDAGQRPRGERPGGAGARLVVVPRDDGVQGRVSRVCALEGGLEELGRRHLAPRHEGGEGDGVEPVVLREAHRYCFSCGPCPAPSSKAWARTK